MENILASDQGFMLLHVGLAIFLGGIIGLEREWKQKPAGLRTHMIISGASALFVLLGRVVITDFQDLASPSGMGMDPIRILHAVIVGVGFLGAGTILKSSEDTRVKYLTTSATIWMASALGLTVGLKQYVLAIGITLIMVTVNILFDKVNEKIEQKSKYPKKDGDA